MKLGWLGGLGIKWNRAVPFLVVKGGGGVVTILEARQRADGVALALIARGNVEAAEAVVGLLNAFDVAVEMLAEVTVDYGMGPGSGWRGDMYARIAERSNRKEVV